MTYKTILLHLDAATRAERLDVAFEQAERFGAHLVGLYAPGSEPIPSYVVAESGPVLTEIVRKRRLESALKAKEAFQAASAKRRVVSCEWRESAGDADAAACAHARYADLVIAAQPSVREEQPGAVPWHFASNLVLGCGRPVLFVPYAGEFPAIGKRVLVAWDGSREAARAVSDSLGYLARANFVEIVSLGAAHTGTDGGLPGADLALVLARHGVAVTVSGDKGFDAPVGEQILSRAADFGADLIVMGAYGHARLREIVLGGVTRTLLESMTVPVLMAH